MSNKTDNNLNLFPCTICGVLDYEAERPKENYICEPCRINKHKCKKCGCWLDEALNDPSYIYDGLYNAPAICIYYPHSCKLWKDGKRKPIN